MHPTSRREFLKSSTTALAGAGALSFLAHLPRVSADDAQLDPKLVRLNAEIEPLVRVLEDTPREKLLEAVAEKIRKGLSYRELLAALLLAGVRNIQPRPHVGFKFHAVLVINSAHLASLNAPDTERWLPIFWALDQFKSSQAATAKESGWRMAPVDDSKVPPPHKARAAFAEAMDKWDEGAADVAVAGLARAVGAHEAFEIFARYGARDFRDIGHKAIYVANSFRTLQCIGWQNAEPVLRSLAYALLMMDDKNKNPAQNDLAADRPWRRNAELAASVRAEWLDGKVDDASAKELFLALRTGNDEDCTKLARDMLNKGVAPRSISDAVLCAAGELLMRLPGIATLHSLTMSNALHYAYDACANDQTRLLLLLQNVSVVPLFRGVAGNKLAAIKLDELEPAPLQGADAAPAEIFADVSKDKLMASRKTLTFLKEHSDAKELIDAARVLTFLKGNDSHDYKFSSAVLEDYRRLSPGWREKYLAASMFYLRGAGAKDSDLVKRTRAAFKA
ncbi:MAG TPA: hypothetical protein VKX17_07880 [Planctomycetota bacterium]|nr:hypothetical protein [Planctomycetota bacterium]